MNAALGVCGRRWGLSMAADRVWAEVSGLSPSASINRLFVVLQAFIDESFEQDGIFVLGGYIASPEAWSSFSREWDRLLPYALLGNDGYYFKMRQMAADAERMKRLPLFFDVIEQNVLGWMSVRFDIRDLRLAISRIHVPNVELDWGPYSNPWYVAFRALIDMFHMNRERSANLNAIPIEEKVDFYFDNRAEKKAILSTWDNYLSNRPEIKKYFGATPSFRDDMDFLPLQAADFWAWWVRKWAIEGSAEKILEPDFGFFKMKTQRRFYRFDAHMNVNDITQNLKETLRSQFPEADVIYDVSWAAHS